MFAELNKICLTILEKNAPTEKKLVSNIKKTTSEKPWMTKEITHLVSEKHRYFKEYKLTQSAEPFASFKKYRNLVNRKLKEAHNQFSEDFCRKIETTKEKWKFITKKIGKKNNTPNITEIDENGKKTKDKKSICNAFNRVFSEMGIYRGQIVPLNVEKIERTFQEFNFRPFTLREIYKVIDNLDNNGKNAIGTYLQIMFNDCIHEKVFPTILKDAHITPIFKKGDVSVLTNYRPISVTTTFAKVFERLLLNQLLEYLEKFALLNKKQFGFQSLKSSTDAVLYFIEKIIGNMQDNDTGAVFLDLAKAFNSISHEIFLKKAENFNLSQSTILLLKSFLENRTHCVKLGIDLSDKLTINHGAPQGTVLGPLIFLLYVNDFSEKLEGENDVVEFADDTSIICKIERNENIPQKIEKILEQTDKYLTENQLTLNADKTEMLFFTDHTNSDPKISFKGEVIKPAKACRYLGVQIDSNLTFENHLNSVLSKMANAIRSLYLVRNQIPLKVTIDVFKSVVLSHLSFSGVFLQTLTVKNIIRINRQINWRIKVCYFRQNFDHSIDLLIKDRILPAELFISKVSLMKLQTDIKQWEISENFKMFTSCHNARKNNRTNQIILKKKTKTKWSNKS